MCGIYGVVSRVPDKAVDRAALKRMGQVLYHRGPDDEGCRFDGQAGLGVRRLSIIDLAHGQQPVTNEDDMLWLVFNGEIYNYRELRDTLGKQGHVFTSGSDTEVIIHAFEEYGDSCVEHLNGMFAFAIWDVARRRLTIVRDRLGIKPLYYWASDDQIVFGSELKAVIAHPDVPRAIDLIALDQFLTLEYIPSPRTIFQGIHKLPPAHRLVFEGSGLTVEPYWDVHLCEIPRDEAACAEVLAELIRDAVHLQLVSDVPVGALLSGGIDSSAVVAFMSEASSMPVQTFSIGFDDQTYNELPYARSVAAHFVTDHHEEVLQPDIASLSEKLVRHLDEPFADFSIFPTYLVSELASQSVKVVLSGDGGDEVFGGYETYVAQSMDRYYRCLPAVLRRQTLPTLMDRVPPQPAKRGLINKAKRFVEGAALPVSLQHTRWMMFVNDSDKAQLYQPDLQASLDGRTVATLLETHFRAAAGLDPFAQQQYVDIKTYLVDDILTKVDRMSMAASIEARVPLLDHRIVEFALSLPSHHKLRRGRTKLALRRAMRGRLPKAVLNRPKQGFSIPLKHWLRGSLKPLMMDLLSADCVRRRGYFAPQTVDRWVADHLRGYANHSHRLWALMVFELWHRQMLDEGANPR
ncbi:MAG: asparagine synthase (glutamine-hydrolyzing) [Anaerolineae bacterium]|nr:asparagine synthase (glutamine-hydrolyzing) [Anaerolineae bacterium]